ncbi:hypothetical protein A6F68_02636 [Tsuneonella dongtanensis]|uniref:Outer membrane lipoprotein-sorting protein n=1 Tax=Tsuneonella dongtanensis TaxID=692370 RepID=A0A1B2AG58_9SPHN|nr:hypothetical protein [Tsuneonella dongtanensis]ANY21130.1 hypothetical protein A6F68_02636 [Tsuneonella dongtanensis]
MRPLAALFLFLSVPLNAEDGPREILEKAIEVAGGEIWLAPRTLVLEGTADFYAPDKPGVASRSDDYRMWRAMDPDRKSAHGADGKVRILARKGTTTMFEVGFDGETTWNDKGVVPKAEADAYWASNFGFGVIRQALKDGFRLESAPGRTIDGHALDMIRVIDPGGQATLFGIDRESRFIRYMGFATPRGWHERVYDDFVMLKEPRWLQAREVTLFYNGVRANTVHWKVARVNDDLPAETFAVPSRFKERVSP